MALGKSLMYLIFFPPFPKQIFTRIKAAELVCQDAVQEVVYSLHTPKKKKGFPIAYSVLVKNHISNSPEG